MALLKKFYLCAYNAIEVIGWSIVLHILVSHYGDSESTLSLWDKIRLPLIIIQLSAYFEVMHAMMGLVRSNAVITFLQVSSRAYMCMVLLSLPSEYVESSFSLPYTVLSWSITEIIRYFYYLLNLVSFVPSFLTWLRYSTFLVLYPTGISGELWITYNAIVYFMSHPELWSYALPNPWNFTFSYLYFLIIVCIIYIPGSPFLFSHMLAQRKKILSTKSTDKKVK